MGDDGGAGRWWGRLGRLKRSRDLSLEEIAKYYVNIDSVLHAQLISVDLELKGQIINSGVRVILACPLSWPGWRELEEMVPHHHHPTNPTAQAQCVLNTW